MRGRKPLPANVLQLRGTARRDRVLPSTWQPEVGLPEAPEQLGPLALEEWRRIGPTLARGGVLALVDAQVLAGYCVAVELALTAAEDIRKRGSVIRPRRGRSGIERRNPSVGILFEALERMRSLASELGITPAARRRVGVLPQASTTEDDEILD